MGELQAQIDTIKTLINARLSGPFYIMASGVIPFAGNQSFAGFRATDVGMPLNDYDATPKKYVDTMVQGLDWKPSVKAATTGPGVLFSSFENGDSIDGVTLATNDRILIKNQTVPSENGIYTVNASGSPSRSLDANDNFEVTAGMAVFVSQGTVNGNTQWVLSTDDAIVIGTTALVFIQIGGSAGTSYSSLSVGTLTVTTDLLFTGGTNVQVYKSGSNQNLTNGVVATVTFQTEVTDTLNEWDTTNNIFTPTASGNYLVSYGATVVGGPAVRTSVTIWSYASGAPVAEIARIADGTLTFAGGLALLYLTAGTSYVFRVYVAGTSYYVLPGQNYTYLNIRRHF